MSHIGKVDLFSNLLKKGPDTAPSYEVVSGGNIEDGYYTYAIAYVFDDGSWSTVGKKTLNVVVGNGNNTVNLSNISIGPEGTVSRKILRNKPNDYQTMYVVDTINDNTTTTYVDTKSNSNLALAYCVYNTQSLLKCYTERDLLIMPGDRISEDGDGFNIILKPGEGKGYNYTKGSCEVEIGGYGSSFHVTRTVLGRKNTVIKATPLFADGGNFFTFDYTETDGNNHSYNFTVSKYYTHVNASDHLIIYTNKTDGYIKIEADSVIIEKGLFKLKEVDSSSYCSIYAKSDRNLYYKDSSGTEKVLYSDRKLGVKGANVASANDITLGDGNFFLITGTTELQRIYGVGWTAGSQVILTFDSSINIKNGVSSSFDFYGFKLAGSTDFSAAAGDMLTLIFDGYWWRETSRTVL